MLIIYLSLSHHVKRVPYPHQEVVLKMLNMNILVSGHVYCAEYALLSFPAEPAQTAYLGETANQVAV